MVYPGENELAGDTGCSLDFLTALRGLALFKELLYGCDASGNEFLCINRADTLNVYNIVTHNRNF